jgi:eukaryotic-like serine/threonine-protein kinase
LSVTIGTQLGSYEITALLGKGGMGAVWRARDTKLKREVAIKILPDEFSRDHDRVIRFQREAEILASLNHTNIAGIFDLQEANGSRFLVLELVEGETLADRIAKGALHVDEAQDIAKHICEALEAAHEKGIVHRDLKPANIKITPEGKVKILDFGLAKAIENSPANAALSNSPTLSIAATQAGIILGTAAYMSPEQAKGKRVDKRADIWAFGVVLYEMLTGKMLFSGETVSETMAAVMLKEPDWNTLPKGTPLRLRELLRRCLVKDPRNRLRDIGDARLAIEEIVAQTEADAGQVVIDPSTPLRQRGREWLAWIVAVAALLIGGSMFWYAAYFRPAPKTDIGVVRFSVSPPEKTKWGIGPTAPYVSVSPDGRSVAFVTQTDDNTRIWVRSIDSLEAHPLTGTEGVSTGGATPFWSPDSRSIGFFAQGKLKRIDAVGGPIQTLGDAGGGRGGTWNRDGMIVFDSGATGALKSMSAGGGRPEAITTLDSSRQELGHVWPYFLPDGDHFLYLALSSAAEHNAIFAGSLSSKQRKLIINADSRMAYDKTAGIIFVRDGTLMALPFDAAKLEVRGEAFPIAENVAYNPLGGAASLSVSQNGVLAYRVGTFSERVLTWFDRSGKILGTVGKPGNYLDPKLSPDERRLAIERVDPQSENRDIWSLEMERGVMNRLTSDPAFDEHPVWSPKGDQIAFRSTRNGTDNIYVKPSSGARGEEALFKAYFAWDWSADGRFILYGPEDGRELSVMPLFGDRKPFTYLPRSQFIRSSAQLSSDGRWIAYSSNESGQPQTEIYIQTFPNPSGKWQISTSGGIAPRWRRDSKEIFFISPDGKLMAVPLQSTGSVLEVSRPTFLFDIPILTGVPWPQYDVSADGQRFLVNSVDEGNVATPITVIVNWTAALKPLPK